MSTETETRCRCSYGWQCIAWPTQDDGLCDHCRDECQPPTDTDHTDTEENDR